MNAPIMRQIFTVNSVLPTICFIICIAATAHAQSGNKPTVRPAQQPQTQSQQTRPNTNSRPSTKTASTADDDTADERAGQRSSPQVRPVSGQAKAPAEPPKISPELEKLLQRWETESAKIKTLHGIQSRSEFNNAFEVEKVTRGPFFLETPDKGRIDMLEVKFKKDDVSKKKNKSNEPYALETGSPEKWICTGESIVQVDENAKSYTKIEIPEDQRGSNIVHSPLPFLFGMKAEEAKTRYILELRSNTDETAMIVVTPRMEKDRQNYRKAAITLNKKTFLPTRVHMLGEEGMEVVYTFEATKVNESKPLITIPGWTKDPYHPDLKKYKLVIPNDPTEVQPVGNNIHRGPRQAPNDIPVQTGPPRRPSAAASAAIANGTSR
jgi:TIGR03009 family protein